MGKDWRSEACVTDLYYSFLSFLLKELYALLLIHYLGLAISDLGQKTRVAIILTKLDPGYSLAENIKNLQKPVASNIESEGVSEKTCMG